MASLKTLSSLALLVSLTVSGCRHYDPIEQPRLDYPAQWQTLADADAIQVQRDWWNSFQSPQLNALIEEALQNSPDILITAERVRQAELQLRSTGASLFPSISASASSGSRRNRPDGGEWQDSDSSSLSLGVSYEVDVWGRVAASVASARYGFAATRFDQEAATLSVTASVANAWFQWLSLQARVATARENLAIAENIERIVQVRYENGVASAADLSRQRSSVLSLQSSLLPLELQSRQAFSAIAILLGRTTESLELANIALQEISVPMIDAGVPADIIVRRPDLASAEAQLYAANANVTAARTALLPGVSLSGSGGLSGSDLFSLASASQSVGWSVSLAQTIFDGGRLRNQVAISQSRRMELVESYRKAILVALQEVDNALDSAATYDGQEIQQTEIVNEARRTLRLTEVRYREGSDDLMSLLDAQRSLYQAEDALVQLRVSRLNAAINLYKTLGGGWSKPEHTLDVLP